MNEPAVVKYEWNSRCQSANADAASVLYPNKCCASLHLTHRTYCKHFWLVLLHFHLAKNSAQQCFCIKYLHCDHTILKIFQHFSHHCCTVMGNPLISSQGGPEVGQPVPCESPSGLWSGVSISRKALWRSCGLSTLRFNGPKYCLGLYINNISVSSVCGQTHKAWQPVI